jgi:hypothetical protein
MSVYILRFLKLHNGFRCGFLMDRVIQVKGLYVYYMYNIAENFGVSIAPVRRWGELLVVNTRSLLIKSKHYF